MNPFVARIPFIYSLIKRLTWNFLMVVFCVIVGSQLCRGVISPSSCFQQFDQSHFGQWITNWIFSSTDHTSELSLSWLSWTSNGNFLWTAIFDTVPWPLLNCHCTNFVLFVNHVGDYISWNLWFDIGSSAFMSHDPPQDYQYFWLIWRWKRDSCNKDFA